MVSSLNFKSNRIAIGCSRIPSNSIPQALCPDPISNLAQMAAVKAREAAEAYFTLRHFDCAIMQARAAKELYPDFPGMDNYMAAYQIHSAVSHKKNWYHVLGITNPAVADSEAIKKQYKRLALALHPDKNGSIAADGAFKYVKAAWDVLSDHAKREAYDKSLSPRSQGARGSNNRKPAQQQRSNACSRKRAGPDANTTGGDGSFYKKTIKIVRKSNPGQRATVVMLSVCRVA